MDRREFILLSSASFLTPFLSISCERSVGVEMRKEITQTHIKFFEHYNEGNIELLVSEFYDIGCTYMSDSISGDIQKLKNDLKTMYNWHRHKNILPIRLHNIKVNISKEIAWVLSDFTTTSKKTKYGSITRIFKRSGSNWKIVHDHFSS